MTFFNSAEPVLRRKQHHLDLQDRRGLLSLQLKLGPLHIDTVFTRIDQVFILWGALCALIFGTAQFVAIDWGAQAIFWSLLTILGTALTMHYSWFWASVERALPIVLGWVALMLAGLILTDLSIVFAWGEVMLHLGVLWLALGAVGYLATGLALRSRALLWSGLVHVAAAVAAFNLADWQFLLAGVVLSGCLIVLGSTQWDMRLPIAYALEQEGLLYNREQQILRQSVVESQR